MTASIKYDDALGQHMTPERIARLVCRELPHEFDVAIDYAVGHGDLLAPLRKRWPDIKLHGIDCDLARLKRAAEVLGKSCVSLGDGVTAPLPRRLTKKPNRFLAVLNPPFVPLQSGMHQDVVAQAFPGVRSRHGLRRLEVAFMARALVDARAHGGWVAIILPSAFCSGLQYASYRKDLLENYSVAKAIEIRHGHFRDTEATTSLLIIDAAESRTHEVEIAEYDLGSDALRIYHRGRVEKDMRLDATFWSAAHLHSTPAPKLGEVGAEIRRGTRSRAEAARVQQTLLHTTDLARQRGNRIALDDMHYPCSDSDVFAEPGDILLPRTGTRVRWEPVEVASGRAPISDHVLRIRSPQGFRNAIRQSFRHPDFSTWLRSVSKGVCATVITKHELLNMPLFALSH